MAVYERRPKAGSHVSFNDADDVVILERGVDTGDAPVRPFRGPAWNRKRGESLKKGGVPASFFRKSLPGESTWRPDPRRPRDPNLYATPSLQPQPRSFASSVALLSPISDPECVVRIGGLRQAGRWRGRSGCGGWRSGGGAGRWPGRGGSAASWASSSASPPSPSQPSSSSYSTTRPSPHERPLISPSHLATH